MTYQHLRLALGVTLAALVLRILSLAPILNWLSSLTLILVPGAVAAWTLVLGGAQTTRWRLRHFLGEEVSGEELGHLDRGLQFLVQNARIVVLEADHDGLFLEAPKAFTAYVERLIPGILPGGRLARQRVTRTEKPKEEKKVASRPEEQTLGERWPVLAGLPVASLPLPSFLATPSPLPGEEAERYLVALEHPSPDILLWGLQEGRKVRMGLVQDLTGQLIVTAAVNLPGEADPPPGRWQRIPPWPFLKHPIFGTPLQGRVSDVLPRVQGPSVYSIQSRLLYLPPPISYTPQPGYRILGTGLDGPDEAGSPLAVPYPSTILSVNATESFLDRQMRNDAHAGRAMVVISPHRALLKELAERVRAPVLVDMENAIEGGHVPIITHAERSNGHPDLAVKAVLDFLAEQGLDQSRPQILEFARHTVMAVLEAARLEERDAGLLDLYALSRGPNSLYSFLAPRAHYWQSAGIDYLANLVGLMRDDLHDFQVMAMLDALRTALNRIRQVGTLTYIAGPPFPDLTETLQKGGALMCTLNDRDFPENDRYLRAMFEMAALRAIQMTLRRAQDSTDVPVSVYLHHPTVYSSPASLDRWLKLAKENRVSLLIDLNEREWLKESELRANHLAEHLLSRIETKLLFHCPENLAGHLSPYTKGWDLPCPLTELAEMPDDTALARLPDGHGRWFTATMRVQT